MKRFIIALLLTSLTISSASAQDDPAALAQQAANAYQQADYKTAVAIYETLLQENIHSGAVYFNLGSAYFEANDLGHALVNYRRAQAFIPRDPDLNKNITLIQASRIDIQDSERAFIDSLGILTVGILTLKELSWIAFAFWTAMFAILLMRTVRPGLRGTLQLPLRTAKSGLLIAALLLGFRLYVMTVRPPAVVVAPLVDVMSGPGEDYIRHFSLHSGAEFRILESRDNWVRFILPDNRQGWLPEDAFERIY